MKRNKSIIHALLNLTVGVAMGMIFMTLARVILIAYAVFVQ